MVSLWERESMLSYNVIVIGAGISGLSTAASIKEKRPELEVLVIERGTLPSGASTRNAGFACFGSLSELSTDLQTLGDDGTVALVQRRWDGLQKTISRLGANHIEFFQKGAYELLNDVNSHYLDQMEVVNTLLAPIFPKPVFQESNQLKTFGFGKTKHLIYNPYEGQLHTGKLMQALWKYCGELGIKIITGTEVLSLDKQSKAIAVKTTSHTFIANTCAICTNAFTPQIVKEELDISPGRGMVMLIQPQKNLAFEGIFHFEEGYYYFRDFHGKILFGGGRNLDLNEETTTQFGLNDQIIKKLHRDLKEVIIPGMDYQTEMQWSGIMAFGATKEPIIKELSPQIHLGIRLGGMGVALGSMVGEQLAEQIIAHDF